MQKFFIKYWPLFTLTLLVCLLGILNYVPGTWLTGWDNLHPEFNFPLNIKRSFFSVWEEYQSLGLLGGHAHSTDILRQLLLYGVSSFLPDSVLRYFSTLGMLLLGTLGSYILIRYLVLPEVTHDNEDHAAQKHYNLYSFLGACFYLLNLATLQTFYAPFESFTAHFAALPWLLFSSLTYLIRPNPRTRLLLVLTLLLSILAAYIPTLFVVYGLALGLCVLVYASFHRTRQTFLRILRLGVSIFLINAFWLLPFLYFTLTNSSVNLHSKINQMATETIYLQNKEFGTIPDVMLLKGFWFNNTDPNREMVFSYMMEPWRHHLSNPLVSGIGFLLFFLVLVGAGVAMKKKRPLGIMFFVLLVFSFTALAIATPPFSWVNNLFRESIPLLNQAFRFPFTKFSILAGLTYAVLLSFALPILVSNATRLAKHLSLPKQLPLISISSLFLLFLIIFSFPVFTDNLFYEKERVTLPKEYQELFSFFSKQNHATRIANLPQYTFWGWSFYSWGYGGSGFLWYGIPQPILDRAFDVWSQPAENYYYELSQAIYTKNPENLRAVLDKYQISWLLVDENIVYPPSPKVLFYADLKQLITATPGITEKKRFGKITIYQVNGVQNTSQFVYTTSTLPTVNSSSWMSDDLSYRTLGTYAASDNPEYVSPFRSLSTVKSAHENTVQVAEDARSLTFTSSLPASEKTRTLIIPSYSATERVVPVLIRSLLSGQQLIIEAIVTPPQITIGDATLGGKTYTRRLFNVSRSVSFPLKLQVNGDTTIDIPASPKTLVATTFSLREPNILTLTPKVGSSKQINIDPQELRSLPILQKQNLELPPSEADRISMRFLKITDPSFAATVQAEQFKPVANCDGFRNGSFDTQVISENKSSRLQFVSDNATACTSYYAGTLPHDLGYVLQITAVNEQGRPLHFWVENIDQRRGPIDTYLPPDRTLRTNTYFLPPLESFGRAYAFHFDNISIGKEPQTNTLKQLTYYPFPYAYASSLLITTDPEKKSGKPTLTIPTTIHPNESLYTVQVPAQAKTLILSQAYAPGWKAYQVNDKCQISNIPCQMMPFLFGKELTGHIKVNDWANGWVLSPNSGPSDSDQIVIVFLPQYLQYFGLFLTIVTCLIVAILASITWRRA